MNTAKLKKISNYGISSIFIITALILYSIIINTAAPLIAPGFDFWSFPVFIHYTVLFLTTSLVLSIRHFKSETKTTTKIGLTILIGLTAPIVAFFGLTSLLIYNFLDLLDK